MFMSFFEPQYLTLHILEYELDQDLYTQSTHSLYAKQEGERISFRKTKTIKQLPTQDRTFHSQEAGGVP